jgi:hypothetical protein
MGKSKDPLLAAMASWISTPAAPTNHHKDQHAKPRDRENPDGIYPAEFNINDKKIFEEWRNKYLANETTTRNLIEKPMVQAVLKQIGHGLRTSFVDIARRESATLAAR